MCLFCKIANGEIPCYKIYEDEEVLAFLDIAKDVTGHTVVISKKHTDNLVEADEKTYFALMGAVKKIANHYVKDLGFDGVNILSNCGEAAGQSVMHMHYHIIPRKNNDGNDINPKVTTGAKEELEETLSKLTMVK